MTTLTVLNLGGDGSAKKISWVGMADAETGAAAGYPQFADRSIQVTGTFDSASVSIQGSNDGTNYASLTDPQGNALTFSSAKIEAVQELTNYLRPVTSGGAGSADLNVYLIMRRPAQLRT